MREITKGPEPRSLSQHRATAHSNYANYNEKDSLRAALIREQRGLCCYCMTRIEPTGTAMKIEHWRSQSRNADLELVYSNLLAACLGGQGQPATRQHCDTRKGEQELKFNPANVAHRIEQRIRFEMDGTIASSDADFDAQLNDVLNLNLKVLQNRRKGIVDGLVGWLRDYRARHYRGPDNTTLQRKRSQLMPANGHLEPYVRVAVWWLDQRLAGGAP
ncbi:retron system putative HNH endonuclease [Lysobacter tyrosinilyticus]